ncbi:hypothetical protein JD844_001307 [Phrynosoma platyrhinos]|uniref:Uncharacterized protein n=1 Tax=Phrynosoma platyrhinos TaxID=52577 RepID=A0ABQ7T9G7_PHRPL|nr:hypothetical protein JD844_001307 [Phrynosoma platyrhinos]
MAAPLPGCSPLELGGPAQSSVCLLLPFVIPAGRSLVLTREAQRKLQFMMDEDKESMEEEMLKGISLPATPAMTKDGEKMLEADKQSVKDEDITQRSSGRKRLRSRARKEVEWAQNTKPLSTSPKKRKLHATLPTAQKEAKDKHEERSCEPDSSSFKEKLLVVEDGRKEQLVIRRVKKEKNEERDLEVEVEVRRVSTDANLVSGTEEDSPPEEEMKVESEEQKAQEFEVQKVTIPVDGSLVNGGKTQMKVCSEPFSGRDFIKAYHIALGYASDGSADINSPHVANHNALCGDSSISNGNNDTDGEDSDRLLICSQCGKGFHMESSPQERNQEDSAMGDGPYSCTECDPFIQPPKEQDDNMENGMEEEEDEVLVLPPGTWDVEVKEEPELKWENNVPAAETESLSWVKKDLSNKAQMEWKGLPKVSQRIKEEPDD